MQKYTVRVEETLYRDIDIDADSADEAIQKVEEMHKNEEIVLDSSDYIGEPLFSIVVDDVTKHKNILDSAVFYEENLMNYPMYLKEEYVMRNTTCTRDEAHDALIEVQKSMEV